MKFKLKKGDNVIVTAGKSRGKQGKVVKVFPLANKVVVGGVNLVKRRERSRREGKKGQVLEKAAPLHASNVQIFCAGCGKGGRIGYKLEKNAKVRICRRCEREI
jgi:large subunit ribosomal protein L24